LSNEQGILAVKVYGPLKVVVREGPAKGTYTERGKVE